MKTLLIFCAIAVLTAFASGVSAEVITIDNPLNATSAEALINNVIDFVFWIAVALVPLMALIAAFYFITAGGDPKRVSTAKTILIFTAIGLLVVLFAKGLASVLKSILGG